MQIPPLNKLNFHEFACICYAALIAHAYSFMYFAKLLI